MYLAFYDLGMPIREDTEVLLDTTGYLNSIKQLRYLFPVVPANTNFDFFYMDYILRYDFPFVDLMNIIYPLYESKSVGVVYNPSANMYLEQLEALIKVIQTRYGIYSSRIMDVIDLDYPIDTDFTIQGLYNLDIDKARFIDLSANPSCWTKPPMYQATPQQIYSR